MEALTAKGRILQDEHPAFGLRAVIKSPAFHQKGRRTARSPFRRNRWLRGVGLTRMQASHNGAMAWRTDSVHLLQPRPASWIQSRASIMRVFLN